MQIKTLAVAMLATMLTAGAAVDRAEAVVAGPATTAGAVPTGDAIQKIRWVCGPSRCDWIPLAIFHPRPTHTRNWNTPRTPGCFYEKRRGRWRENCPQ